MSQKDRPRIASLLPSLTEIVCELGFKDCLVGRSHECDFPAGIDHLPVLTAPKYPTNSGDSSSDIHQSITELLRQGLSVYEVDAEKLAELNPDIILTQDHCEVCAVSFSDLERAIEDYLKPSTQIISVSPINLRQVLESFQTVADALESHSLGKKLVQRTQTRFDELRNKTPNRNRPDVIAIEWMNPIMTGGNWMPELIDIAGGENLLSEPGSHSPWIEWEKVIEADPDILLLLPCGYSIDKTMSEIETLTEKSGWTNLKAVKNNRVYILDGNQYFNRSGPRIKESAEILAEIFYPSIFKPHFKGSGWIDLKNTFSIKQ